MLRDPVRFDGRFYQIPESQIGPKPVRRGGPLPGPSRK